MTTLTHQLLAKNINPRFWKCDCEQSSRSVALTALSRRARQ